MGQRLIFELKDNEEVFAVSYFHWSAYYVDAMYTMESYLKEYKKRKKNNPELGNKMNAIIALQSVCSGIDYDIGDTYSTIKYLNKFFGDYITFKIGTNRNEGLIALWKKGIESLSYYGEGTISYDIDSNMIDTDLWYPTDIETLGNLISNPSKLWTKKRIEKLKKLIFSNNYSDSDKDFITKELTELCIHGLSKKGSVVVSSNIKINFADNYSYFTLKEFYDHINEIKSNLNEVYVSDGEVFIIYGMY